MAGRGIAADDRLDRAARRAGRRGTGSGCRRRARASGHTGSASSARRMASNVACRMLRQSISSRSAQPTAQASARARMSARQALALRGRQHLGVGKSADAAARVENHRRGDHRAGQRAAAGLVDAGHARQRAALRRAHRGPPCARPHAARAPHRPRARRRRGAACAWMAREFVAAARPRASRSSSSLQQRSAECGRR